MVNRILTQGLCCCYVFIYLNFLGISSTIAQRGGNNWDIAGEIEGDIALGGLFRIRNKRGINQCGETVEVEVGIQRVEAMVYAIQKVNKDPDLLPNVTLGAEIRDTCSLGTVALEESLKFVLDSLSFRATSRAAGNCARNDSKDVVGVVGPSRSSFSIEVANLLRLFKVPQVSYASTSAELSNNDKYSYFARTVPPDTQQALAMFDVVKELEWSSVFTVNSEGSYGEKGMEQFKKYTENSTVCIVSSRQVTDRYSSQDYDDIIDNFSKISPTTRVVILFMKDNHVKKLLKTARKKNFTNVVWIGSDEWGTREDVVDDLGDFFDKSDAITVTLNSSRLLKFEDYFKSLNGTERRNANPWFQQYWKQHCNSTCNLTNSYSPDYKFNDKLPYVMDAVYAFAHALHEMYAEKCPEMKGLCQAMKPIDGTELRNRLFNISFRGSTANRVAFDRNGDSRGKYNLFHYTSQGYELFGVWQGVLNVTGNSKSLRKVQSTCSDQCHPWSRRVQKEGVPCCSTCFDCLRKDRQYFKKDGTTQKCVDCDEHQRPNADYTGCEDLPLRYMPSEWVIVVSIFAGLGILCTLTVVALFLYYVETPIVKASGRDLIFPLLAGVLLSYIMTFFLISKPSVGICGIQRFGIGFSSSLCYASILIKTNRIARIFAERKSLTSVNFTKPHTQLVILILLIGIEVSLGAVGLIMKPPGIDKVLPTSKDVLAKCNITKYDYAINLTYNLLLIILCTIYSFRTRKTPSTFNEARYLGFVMYTTCIIWIAFLPVYYGTAENYQAVALSLNASLNATTILVCLFGPKIYIIVFRPSRNVRSSTNGTISHSMGNTSSSVAGDPYNFTLTTRSNEVIIQDTNSSEVSSENQNSQNAQPDDVISRNLNSDAIPQVAEFAVSKDVDTQDEVSIS